MSLSIRHSSTKPLRNSPSSASFTGGFGNRTAKEELSGPTSCSTRWRGSRWSSSGYTSRGMCWAGRSMRHSGSPRACFCWARLVSGGRGITLCRPAAKSRRVLILRLLDLLGFGPAGTLRGGDTRSSLGTHPMLLLSGRGSTRALGRRRRGRRLFEHAAQLRHLRFNLLEVLLVTHQSRFQGRVV